MPFITADDAILGHIYSEAGELLSNFQQLERATLSEQISRNLLEIIEGEGLKPGDALPSETALAKSFKVSRPVIREALAQLKSLGLVRIASGRPPVIREVDSSLPRAFFQSSVSLRGTDADELFEVRRCLEVESATLAARRASAADIADLHAIATEMAESLKSNRLEQFVRLDLHLHLRISSASGNMILHHLIEGIEEPVRDSIRLGIASRPSKRELEVLSGVHEDIVSAISAHDEGAAAAAMASHFDKAIASIRKAQQ